MVRAKETRYQVPGWGVGELWTSDRAVLAHAFAFGAAAGSEPHAASRPQAPPLEGAASPPLGTVLGQQARVGNDSVPTPRQPSTGAELDANVLVARVAAYLAGADMAFDDVPLDLGDCTAFQQAVAESSEQYISALYGYNVSKALLARGLGLEENAARQYLGGVRQ